MNRKDAEPQRLLHSAPSATSSAPLRVCGSLWVLLGAALAAGIACRCSYANDRLLLADGAAVEARLADAAADGKLAFDAGGKQTAPDSKDLVRWGRYLSPRGTLAVLDGGDMLVYARAKLDGDALTLTTNRFGDVRVPIHAVRGLVVRSPASLPESDRVIDELASWEKDATASDLALDRITLDNGDVVEGKVVALNEAETTVETEAGRIKLAADRVRSIALGRRGERDSAASGLRLVIGASDGSRVTATSVSLAKEGVKLATSWAATLTVPREHVVAVQTLGGRATYLSDMTASGYRHVPYLATAWPLAVDRSVGGERLRAAGHEYLKGLGVHSAASATYVLDKPYRRFEAELAIDDSVYDEAVASAPLNAATNASERRPPRGSVVFRVYTDSGDGGWKLRHTSETIRGGDAPTAVSIDVAGAKRISLIVDFADRADEWDRADWLDARLIE